MDDVILDAPYIISPEMIAALNISVVVTGKVSESSRDVHGEGEAVFAAAEAAGILKVGRRGEAPRWIFRCSRDCPFARGCARYSCVGSRRV